MNIKHLVFIASLALVVPVGATPLHDAAEEGNVTAIKALAAAAAAADLHAKDNSGGTPLHHAVRDDQPVVIEALLAAGARE